MNGALNGIISNMEKVIIGKRETIELILISLLSEGHVLIEDIPGVGKTLLVAALARSVNGLFRRVQFTPDVLPSDITGFSMFNPASREFEYNKGAAMSNFLLADEINRTSPKTQSSLLEVMEEFQVTVDGKTYPVPRPFMVLATQNPVESFGTYPLPEAQMDRFFMKISIGYPAKKEEEAILDRFGSENPLETLQPVADTCRIIELQKSARETRVHESLKAYIVDVVDQTRHSTDVALGVSPRGSLALYKAAKVLAFLRGRDYVLPDDIQEMAYPVLSHRMILSREAGIHNKSGEHVIRDILDKVKVPGFR
ncbi:MAG: MoxR family ATPase [Clostridia bacterium]|nr:MoxR family ATPase [Clostridia bacterium]